MEGEAWIRDLLIVLATAGVVVPLFRRLRMGLVLGFLVAGLLLGPHGLGRFTDRLPALGYVTFSDDSRVGPFAELGVLFLMFTIGLGLSVERLVAMRRMVFGLGLAQVVVTAAILCGLFAWSEVAPPAVALVLGVALAFSSTAVVLQVLAEQRRLGSTLGRASLGVLLLQDLAVVPVMILVGLLGAADDGAMLLSVGKGLGLAAAGIALMLAGGRYLLRPLMKPAGAARSRELILAIALFIAVGAGVATEAAGLSPALGAFLAGLVLGDTEYRHQVELDIEPFKGLLLGLFFMTVGMSFDIAAVASYWPALLIVTIGLLLLKGGLVVVLARLFRLNWGTAVEAGFLLAGCGEFAFVVFRLAQRGGGIDGLLSQAIMSVAIVTMMATPLLAALGRRLGALLDGRRHLSERGAPAEAEVMTDHIVVGGFGRVGQMVARLLEEQSVPYVAFDLDAHSVDAGRQAGHPVHFGDCGRKDMLDRVGAGAALAFVVTPNDATTAERMVRAIRSSWPEAKIYARARDADHVRRLLSLGATVAVPEAVEGSLQLAGRVLEGIGFPDDVVVTSIDRARETETAGLPDGPRRSEEPTALGADSGARSR